MNATQMFHIILLSTSRHFFCIFFNGLKLFLAKRRFIRYDPYAEMMNIVIVYQLHQASIKTELDPGTSI